MSVPDKKYLRRLIAVLQSFMNNLKDIKAPKSITPAIKKLEEGSAVALKNVENYKKNMLDGKVKNTVTKYIGEYEKITGVQELLALQKSVVAAQERFLSVQERRRLAGQALAGFQQKMLELHAEMQNTSKADERYLRLVTEEHKALIQERTHRTLFEELEKEERERFAEMSSAVKLSHESERAHAERSKYWYIVASICGTIIGVGGSTLNNRRKMSEFKQMMEEEINRSSGIMLAAMGGEQAVKNFDALKLLPSESMNQLENVLSQKIQELDEKVSILGSKYSKVVDSLTVQELIMKKHFIELKQLFVAAFQSSAKSDEKLAELMSEVVHHDDKPLESLIRELPKPHVDRTALIKMVCALSLSVLLGCVIGKNISN